MTKSVLILAGDAVEALEIYYPYFRCLEEGYEITIAASSAKKLHTVIHDFVGWETYTEKEGYLIDATSSFAEIRPEKYDGLIIPGGRSPEHIRLNEHVPPIVGHFFSANKPIAAVCHASLVLTTIPEHIKSREMTAYIACKPEVDAAGATYVDTSLHIDGNLISGHAWPDLPGLMRAFIEKLNY